MPRIFTVGDLIRRARERVEMENTDYVTDAELKGILSTGYGELYSVLVASGMRYFVSDQTINGDGQASGFALPNDYLSTASVWYVRGNSSTNERLTPLDEIMQQERHLWPGVRPAQVYILGQAEIELLPIPPMGKEYRHQYVPQPPDLSSADDMDTVDVVTPDGEAFLDAYLQVDMLAKEESDVTGAVAKRQRALQRLEEWSVLRSLNTPRRPVVRNFDSEQDLFGPYEYHWGTW